MNNTTGNDVVSSDFLRVLLALKDNIMKDLHCNDIGIVTSVKEEICFCKLLSKPDVIVACTKINNIITDVDDVVFIAYLDSNAKNNSQRLNNNQVLRDTLNSSLHTYENAVIVLNYSKQGSGEGVAVDSSFSTTSTNALQNKLITNRFNQVESRLVNVDSNLNENSTNPVQNKVITKALNDKLDETNIDIELLASSTNPVQNKVLYNPVTFAESERLKTLNLCNNNLFEWGDLTSQGSVESNSTTVIRTKNYISVKPNTQYYLGIGLHSVNASLKYYSSDSLSSAISSSRGFTSGTVITTPENCYYVRICSKLSDTSVNITEQQFYLYEGITDYGYLEYNGAIVNDQKLIKTVNAMSMVPSNNLISGIFNFTKTGVQNYTAPANGYVAVYFVVKDSLPVDLYLSNVSKGMEMSFPRRNNTSCYVPCKKGDTIQFYSSEQGNTQYSTSSFIYAEEV